MGAYRSLGVRLQHSQINGQPGALALDPDGALINVLTLDMYGGSICTIRSVINPYKLKHLGFALSPLACRDRVAHQALTGNHRAHE